MSNGNKRIASDDSDAKAKRTKKEVTSSFSKLADRKPTTTGKQIAKAVGASTKVYNKFAKETNFQKFSKTTENKPEKTDWNKYKQEKKDLKLKRKQSHDLFELTGAAKKIYETLKCKTTANKEELALQLHNLIKEASKKEKNSKTSMPTYVRLALAHDTARVVQCLLKQAPSEAKIEISEVLLPSLVRIAKSKYGLFCVMRLIKYGAAKSQKTRDSIFKSIEGSVTQLTLHQQSAGITDFLYVSYASATQKARMRQEFYGEMYKQTKDVTVVKLSDAYRDSPELKSAVLSSLKAHLNHAINKGVLENGLIHALMLEYLNECSSEDSEELIQLLLPHTAALCCTKEGTKVACMTFWKTPAAKDRRVIVKNVKEHLLKLVTHEHGHILVVAIINSLDDTKAIKKAIFDTMKPQLSEIVVDEFGRKVLAWFLAPEHKTFFHPTMIQYVNDGASASKKSAETRRAEVFQAVEAECVEYFTDHMSEMFSKESIALWVTCMMSQFKENVIPMFQKLTELICDPEWMITSTNGKENKGVESAGIHLALKKMLKTSPAFATVLGESLTSETIEHLLHINRGSFLLVHLLENGSPEVRVSLKNLTAELNLEEFTNPGALLLIKKLNE